MADRIMSRGTRTTSSNENPPSAKDLLENKLEQLRTFLWCLYGNDGWFEDVGEKHRDNLLWLASDLVEEAVMLNQESAQR
jgi:hypothetical protein